MNEQGSLPNLEKLKISQGRKKRSIFSDILWSVIILSILVIILTLAFSSQDRYSSKDTKRKAKNASSDLKGMPDEKTSGGVASQNAGNIAGSKDKGTQPSSEKSSNSTAAQSTNGEELLTVSGYIIPRERIEISPRFMAEVEWIGVKKGDKVKKGDILVKLDAREYKASFAQAEAELKAAKSRLEELMNGTRIEEIEQAEANLKLAEAELKNAEALLKRREKLLKEKSISEEEYDNALRLRDTSRARVDAVKKTLQLAKIGARKETISQAEEHVNAMKANLERIKTYLDWTTISSPVDGVILEKLATVGEMVVPQSFGNTRGPSTALLSIADLNDLQVECELNESDISKIYLEQRCKISPEAYPEKNYEGCVAEIAPEANRQKGTLQVKVQIKNPDYFLTPELTAKVTFTGKKK